MANRIHKHISKALSKRKQSQQATAVTGDSPNPKLGLSEDDEALSQRLDAIIEPAQVVQQEEIEPVEEIILDDNEIATEYKDQFNSGLEDKLFLDFDEQQSHHEATIRNVITHFLQEQKAPLPEQQIIYICEEIRNNELNIQKLFVNIEKQRQILVDFVEQLQKLSSSFEKDKLISFFEAKINNPYYQSIQSISHEVISKGKYITNEDEVIKNAMFHVKILVLLTPYEYGLLSHLIVQTPTITNPYNSAEMEQLNSELDNFIMNFSIHGMEKITRFIHHSIEYDTTLITNGKKQEFLTQVDFTTHLQNSIQPLIENKEYWEVLQNNPQFVQSNIQLSDLATIQSDLQAYQKYLNEFGNLKIQLSINKNDFTVIKQIQLLHEKIVESSGKFKSIKALKTIIADMDNNILKKVKQNLSSLVRLLFTIKNTIKDLAVDNYGIRTILLFRIARGDFFNAQDRDHLISATFAMHKVIQPLKLFNSLIENFKMYSSEKQLECLFFVKNYLILDTDNTLINIKFEQSEVIDKIEMFCQFALENAIDVVQAEIVINEITETLVKKIVDKSNTFSNNMSLISKGEIPQTQLLRRINTMLKDIPEHIHNKSVIEEYLLEVNFIIESPNLISYSDNQVNEQIINSIEKFCSTLQQNTQYNELSSSLLDNLNKALNNQTASQTSQTSTDIDIPGAQNFNLSKLLHEVILGNKLVVENEKGLQSLVEAIESGFIMYFTQIDLAQFRELFWTQDNKRISDGLMPLAPDIRKYNQYFNLVVNFFALTILSQVESVDGEVLPRESLFETKRVYEFIEKAITRAIDKGAFATAIALNSSLNLQPIKRLGLSNPETEAARNSQLNKLLTIPASTNFRSFHQEGLPYLGFILDQIIKDYKRKVGSEFEKRVLIGKIFQSIEEKKHAIKENLVLNDLSTQMYAIMKNVGLTVEPILRGDVIINDNKTLYTLNNASENIKPNEFKTYLISDFHTLPGLRDQLTYWYNRMEDFHISGKNPQLQIVDLVKSLVSQDDNLEHFTEASSILSIIDLIEKHHHRVYKNYDNDLNEILKLYHKKIALLLDENLSEPLDSLDTFFSIFEKDSKIKSVSEQGSEFPLFSGQRHLKESIDLIKGDQIRYTNAISMASESKVQQAYSQLLLKVLEGDKHSPIIQIGGVVQSEGEKVRSLLPDTEFPVPQAEPEHPDYIGINRTMNFNPDAKTKSILQLFSTNELKKDFLLSFPWGLDTYQVKKLETIKYNPGLNLVALDYPVDPHLQLVLMKYILLSLDCMGKLAGSRGELSIANFNQIKSIADALQEVATLLSFSELESEIFITKLDHMSYKLILLNNDLADMLLQSNPPVIVQKNEAMNDFCHINEYLTHKLLGIPYQKSSLTPMNPLSNTLATVNPKFKEDLLRHSGIDAIAIAKLSKQNELDNSTDQS